jgi:hypothetical protein
MRIFFLASVVLMSLASCSGTNTKESEISDYLSVGDMVVLRTKNSSEYEFEVIGITDSAIIGESIVVPLQDIHTARIKHGDVIYETTGKQISDAIGLGIIILSSVPM